jgi:hypothetical protein
MSNKLVGIRLDGELWQRVRMKALEVGKPANAIVADALNDWLARQAGQRVVRERPELMKRLAKSEPQAKHYDDAEVPPA